MTIIIPLMIGLFCVCLFYILLGLYRIEIILDFSDVERTAVLKLNSAGSLCSFILQRGSKGSMWTLCLFSRTVIHKNCIRKKKLPDVSSTEEKPERKWKRHLKKSKLLKAVRRLPGCVMRCCRTVRIASMEVNGVIGTGDPSTTGQIEGAILAFRPFLNERISLNVTPVFHERKFQGKLSLALEIFMIRFLWHISASILSLATAYLKG